MTWDNSNFAVPQTEKEIAEFDWLNFPPNKQMGENRRFSMIDESTGIVGKLITGSAFIHGQIDGLVFAEHVAVERTGYVKGIIFCRTLSVFGKVTANVVCDSIVVRDTGVVSSVLKYRTLRIDQGGAVSGWFERRLAAPERAASPAALEPQAQPLFSPQHLFSPLRTTWGFTN